MRHLFFAGLIGCAPSDDATELDAPRFDEVTAGTEGDLDSGFTFVPEAEDGVSVERLDPGRYLGLWYEIATTPSQQQAFCSGTTAEYSLIDDDTIGVTNRCRIGGLDGSQNRIDGTARALDDTYARLLVDLGFGFEAPYTVIDLVETPDGQPYSHAVVSGGGVQFWILSRTPQISDDLYELLQVRLDERGVDSTRLILTEQPVASED